MMKQIKIHYPAGKDCYKSLFHRITQLESNKPQVP